MTRSEGRRFAWTLAVGFAVLSALAAWRGHATTTDAFAVAALICLAAGVIAPTRLGPTERAWRRVGELISRVTSPIVFTALYYVVFTPAGLLRRAFGRSPLGHSSAAAETFWVDDRKRESPEQKRRALEHLY